MDNRKICPFLLNSETEGRAFCGEENCALYRPERKRCSMSSAQDDVARISAYLALIAKGIEEKVDKK